MRSISGAKPPRPSLLVLANAPAALRRPFDGTDSTFLRCTLDRVRKVIPNLFFLKCRRCSLISVVKVGEFIRRSTIDRLIRLYWKVVFFRNSDPLRNAEKYRMRGMQIGEGTLVYPSVVFGRDGNDPIVIGKNCVLTGCTILGHDASTNRHLGLRHSICKPTIIDDDVFIGVGAIVLMGVHIGRGSIVGAGSVVRRNVPAGCVIGGNPAKTVCTVPTLVEMRRLQIREHPELIAREGG